MSRLTSARLRRFTRATPTTSHLERGKQYYAVEVKTCGNRGKGGENPFDDDVAMISVEMLDDPPQVCHLNLFLNMSMHSDVSSPSQWLVHAALTMVQLFFCGWVILAKVSMNGVLSRRA